MREDYYPKISIMSLSNQIWLQGILYQNIATPS